MTAIVITGAAGNMGQAAVKAINQASDLELVAAITRQTGLGQDAGTFAGLKTPLGISLSDKLAPALKQAKAGVLVELTQGEAAYQHATQALEAGVSVVLGATGLSANQLEDLRQLSEKQQTGIVVAPNFSIGALLMMHFAEYASQYFDWAEIIELHHQHKRDAPSGTALKTAQMMSAANPNFQTASPGFAARGDQSTAIPIHSVRLPGLLAHQEVILGGLGQTLTLRHDSLDRDSFMPGLLKAIAAVQTISHYVYGLDQVIFPQA